jgi:hypothetical protein
MSRSRGSDNLPGGDSGIAVAPLSKEGADERAPTRIKAKRHYVPKNEAARLRIKKNAQRKR